MPELAEVPVVKRVVVFDDGPINLSALGRITGLHRSYLSHVFNGSRNPTISTCRKLAGALEMDLPYFIEQLDRHVASLNKAA